MVAMLNLKFYFASDCLSACYEWSCPRSRVA